VRACHLAFQEHDKKKFHEFLKALPTEKGAFLFANFAGNGNHIIRWSGLKDEDTLFAMDPSFGLPQPNIAEYSLENLIKCGYFGFVLQRRPLPKPTA
jgi:hypothetical protein